MVVDAGVLHMLNNTAEYSGGAILVMSLPKFISNWDSSTAFCSINFLESNRNSSFVFFSGNRAGKGGADIYGAKLIDCFTNSDYQRISHVGQPNETSRYFKTPLMKQFQFTNTDRLSSVSSDPIMVCFCNNSNLPDCSDRTPRRILTYLGLEINTSIATVGYYGGTSPGVVHVSAQYANLVHSMVKMRPPTVSSSTFSCRTHPQQQHWLISRWRVAYQTGVYHLLWIY